MGLMQDFWKADEERRREVKQLQGQIKTMLKEFAEGKRERASEVGKIHNGVATMLKEFVRGDAERRSEVATIHKMVWGKEPARKRVVPLAGELSEEMPPEVAPGELRERVFSYLANHPDGTRLTELEGEFGIARIQIARIVRELMEDNKVEKHDLLYFAL